MEESSDDNKVKGVVDAVTGLMETVPVYRDGLQPAVKEVGKSLETVAKTVNLALAPLKGLVWSFEKLQEFIDTKVATKLQNTPKDDIQTPKGNIVVPALQALSYSTGEPELQELFANLIAGSMDKHTATFAHPSFVESIKQLTPDEAKLLKYISTGKPLPSVTIRAVEPTDTRWGHDVTSHLSLLGFKADCENPHLASVAIDNLRRQGLIVIPHDYSYKDKSLYDELKNHAQVKSVLEDIKKMEGKTAKIIEEVISVTNYGWQFIEICVTDHLEFRK